MPDGPIFLTGVYRSGTTLVAQVLDSHPGLRVIYDTLHFFRFYLASRYFPVRERYPAIVADAAARLDQRWGIKVPKDRILHRLHGLTSPSFGDVYDAIMVETFCGGKGGVRWGEKSLLQWTNIPLFLQMFPTGQAIHIMRDPRDVLASFRENTHEPPHRYLDAAFCCLHSMAWADKIGASLPQCRYRVVRHEDLVTAPEETCRGLCDFLRVEYDAGMLEATRYVDQSGKPWSGDSSFGDIAQAIVPTSVGRWRSKLQGFEIMWAESITGNMMPKFGYGPSDVKVGSDDWHRLWERVRGTPLLQNRLAHWLETGDGMEKYPSDPTDPANWEETPRPL